MIFLEMSRDHAHGGGAWAFPNCVWAPTKKKGGGRWPFWEKVLSVKEGDTVVHLRGVQPNAFFVGYSRATGDGFVTSKRPPHAGEWSFAESFHRADLDGYTPFHRPMSLTKIFSTRHAALDLYFDQNKLRDADRRNIFYVRQSGRLQCLNGAYLSEIDEDLFACLFDEGVEGVLVRENTGPITVETGWQLRSIRSRLGQMEFSRSIKTMYGNRCCFPSCNVEDARFLVGAHIARWSDSEKLRGNMSNGLCLCVFHDKAFELGLFTLDEHRCVHVSPRELALGSPIAHELQRLSGLPIATARVPPSDDALLEHWIRVDLDP